MTASVFLPKALSTFKFSARFKIFVVNPQKPARIQQILVKNKDDFQPANPARWCVRVPSASKPGQTRFAPPKPARCAAWCLVNCRYNQSFFGGSCEAVCRTDDTNFACDLDKATSYGQMRAKSKHVIKRFTEVIKRLLSMTMPHPLKRCA